MKVLILTDHTNHSKENALYSLASKLSQHKEVTRVDVASRKLKENFNFFDSNVGSNLWVTNISQNFKFSHRNNLLDTFDGKADLESYAFIWLRLPPPVNKKTLQFFHEVFKEKVIINDPIAIYETGSKAFLLNFEEVCPPMQLCKSFIDIEHFSHAFPIVLKPLREYGGRGILKIENKPRPESKNSYTLLEFAELYNENPIEYLAVKYLKNVKQGDKRIIVIDGKVMGASLRLPAENSWICNAAMGGSSFQTEIETEEFKIVETLDPIMSSKGIVMYGIDTLVGDDGKRLLSEVNTTSIGGLPQIAHLNGQPLVEEGIDILVNNVLKRIQ